MTAPDCGHTGTVAGCVCPHLLHEPKRDHVCRFTGVGTAFDLLCHECARASGEVRSVCQTCFEQALEGGYWTGLAGTPEVRDRSAGFSFEHDPRRSLRHRSPLLDLQPVRCADAQHWVAVDALLTLLRFDLDAGTVEELVQLGSEVSGPGEAVALHLSNDGRFAAVVNDKSDDARRGVVYDFDARAITMRLERDGYHSEQTPFPLAFFDLDGRTLLIHGSEWNRLDVSDPATGELLTPRELPTRTAGQERPEHYLDYFHGGLAVSPDGHWVADSGWVWHPVGVVTVWDARRWATENVWESEDGPTQRSLCHRNYYWDGPLCWIGNDRLAVWGYGDDQEWLIPAVRVFDMTDGKETHWFPGPKGELAFDRELLSFHPDDGTSVWDVTAGERLHHEASFCPTSYHPSAKTFLTLLPHGWYQISRLRRPPVPEWSNEAVVGLARAVQEDQRFELLPILADALEEAGCSDIEILTHCREPGPHGNTCWVVDCILGPACEL